MADIFICFDYQYEDVINALSFSGASLDNLKEKCRTLKQEVIDCMIDNINEQNSPDSISGLFSLFDLSSNESKEDRMRKLEIIWDMFGVKHHHTMKEKW